MKKILASILFVSMILIVSSCKKTVTIGTKTIDVSKNYTVFISQSTVKDSLDQMRKGFVKGMVERGYVENQNVTYIYENANADSKLASKIADLVIEKKPDLVLSIGEVSTLALKEKVSDIPIVFMGCANAENIGLCDGESMPISNITGVRDSHLLDESLAFIETNYPDVKKLGLIYDVNNALSDFDVRYLKYYATGHDIDIYTVGIKKTSDIEKAINNINPKVDAIFLSTDDMINSCSETIIGEFSKVNKNVFSVKGEIASDKVIYTAEPDKSLVGYEASDIVDLLLKGKEKVSNIKVRDVSFN